MLSVYVLSFILTECSRKFPCNGLGKYANFQSLGFSMLTLFRIATGDNWSGILKVGTVLSYLIDLNLIIVAKLKFNYCVYFMPVA